MMVDEVVDTIFFRMQIHGRARGCRARVSRIKDEGTINLSPSIESGGGSAAGFIAPGINVIMDSLFGRAELRSCLLANEASFKAERDRPQKTMNRYKI